MKRLSDNFIVLLLPLTAVAAIALGIVAVAAFRMEATTAGFIFTALSLAVWISLVAEFFLLYDTIIDKWFSKGRSVLTATWFLVSLLLAFIFTPDKRVDWNTGIIILSLLAVFFLLPYIIGMAYGKRIKSWLRERWDSFFPKQSRTTEVQVGRHIEAVLSTPAQMPDLNYKDM